jgi:flagellar basal body L-ring protein FlgH
MELFADLKARRVGDVLTIVLNEVDQCQQERGHQDREDHLGREHRADDLRQDHHDQGRAHPRHHDERLDGFDGEGTSTQATAWRAASP